MHTDTPESGERTVAFCNWSLCAMHLSGLFEPWRVRIRPGSPTCWAARKEALLVIQHGIDHPPTTL